MKGGGQNWCPVKERDAVALGPARVAVFTWARPRARTGLQESFENKLMPVFLQAIAGVRLNSKAGIQLAGT